MEIIKTKLESCYEIIPKVHGDDRGFFLETFQKERYKDVLQLDFDFVQDNHSRSTYNVLRGLHFQKSKPQGKLVRVVAGEVYDVAVDIRKNSKTFGQWHGVILSESNKKQFWIPPGMAHGFYVLSEVADFEYKCTDYYDPSDEGCIVWNDSKINIDWPCKNPIVSQKDQQGKKLESLL